MSLPEKGWKGYGSPAHKWTPRPPSQWADDRRACIALEQQFHAEVAEYRLRHDGIKPELLAYVRGIGESVR